jgi:hypothetical protein
LDVVQAVAEVLARTGWAGLSNAEITRLLGMLGIADVQAPNKRARCGAP